MKKLKCHLFLPLIFFTMLPMIGEAKDVLRATDEFRLSWREVSVKTPGLYSLNIRVQVCAAQKDAAEMNCADIGSFEVSDLDLSTKTVNEVKKNTPKLSGVDVNKIVEEVSKGLESPTVRLSFILSQVNKETKARQSSEAVFISFPPIVEEPQNERRVLQEKVVVEKNGIRSRILAEVYR